MNRHWKRKFAAILLAALLGVSGVVASTTSAGIIVPGPSVPATQIVENP